ncbi:EcsC family protein [Carnobacterium divergens]|uniref:EcsC family protein n=1 Tax=Carnobacterium divergens TaxID=2748 RepID=A0AAW8R7F0_CARDV|nr:EcsC family protein [Carnobacterium divergens]MDT1957392.1 EcsC family protein [Carnobacterium divergens]MDT1973595.1 EcsC family protein [Carnobacterium divergens]
MNTYVDGNKGLNLLDFAYEKCLNGVPKVSKPISELADDYIKKYGRTDIAINKLIKNQLSKNTINGFVTSFGGFVTMPVTLPDNVTSVIYVQMRMIASIAIIRGYDLTDDEVQTFVYSCMVGKGVTDVFKQAGVQVTNKISLSAVNKIPGRVLTTINQAIGFRFITKAGAKGTINLGKVIPIIGAGVGATFDYTTTRLIANRAKKVFEGNNVINLSAISKEK